MHIRRIIILFLALLVAAILQSTFGSRILLVKARPDLVLLLVVIVSVVRGVEEGLVAGLFGGLLVDMMSVIPFGTAAVGMGLIGLASGLGESNIYRSNFVIPVVTAFVGTIVYHSYLMLVLQAAGWQVEWISTLALQTFPSAVLNAILAPLAVPLVRRLLLAVDNRERMQC